MKQYEYMTWSGHYTNTGYNDALSVLGSKGWKLMFISSGNVHYFCREVEEILNETDKTEN